MSDAELDRVAQLQALGYGVSRIARELNRAKSSISELIALNRDGRYPFLKTTILSIIPKLIPRIWQNKATELQRKLKKKS